MRILLLAALISILTPIQARAADEFSGIKCGDNISQMLMGRQSSNQRVALLEKLHSNLGLKDLGGIEISDSLFLVSWRICGNEYAELLNTKKNLVQDVLPVPEHSLRLPLSFIEKCQVNGKEIPDAVIAILDNSQEKKPTGYLAEIMLPAKTAWKIDEHQEKFVALPIEQLSCTVSGSSADVKP
ncbi:MAG: hypothetical protein WCA21_21165 [Terracidiphilus sp.]